MKVKSKWKHHFKKSRCNEYNLIQQNIFLHHFLYEFDVFCHCCWFHLVPFNIFCILWKIYSNIFHCYHLLSYRCTLCFSQLSYFLSPSYDIIRWLFIHLLPCATEKCCQNWIRKKNVENLARNTVKWTVWLREFSIKDLFSFT